MTNAYDLSNQFLIAMPTLVDSNFSQTVSYLCQHNADGALAITINRPTNMMLTDIFEQMGIKTDSKQIQHIPVFAGGPAQKERGFIIHNKETRDWDSSIAISDTTSLTSSRDVLEAIAENRGPKYFLVALGYAGWGAGQLEKEFLANAWLNSPYEQNILYNTPVKQRWNAAANQLGIDINQLISPAGHA